MPSNISTTTSSGALINRFDIRSDAALKCLSASCVFYSHLYLLIDQASRCNSW